jgi:hypothetical protein
MLSDTERLNKAEKTPARRRNVARCSIPQEVKAFENRGKQTQGVNTTGERCPAMHIEEKSEKIEAIGSPT